MECTCCLELFDQTFQVDLETKGIICPLCAKEYLEPCNLRLGQVTPEDIQFDLTLAISTSKTNYDQMFDLLNDTSIKWFRGFNREAMLKLAYW